MSQKHDFGIAMANHDFEIIEQRVHKQCDNAKWIDNNKLRQEEHLNLVSAQLHRLVRSLNNLDIICIAAVLSIQRTKKALITLRSTQADLHLYYSQTTKIKQFFTHHGSHAITFNH